MSAIATPNVTPARTTPSASFPGILERTVNTRLLAILALATAAATAGCGSSNDSNTCDLATRGGCASGTACEAVQGGSTTSGQCFQPVVLTGQVYRLADKAGVAGARVVALDVNRAPVTEVAVSGTDGTYSLQVPATRQANGAPVAQEITLRADAPGYKSFPSGIRVAVPVDLSAAVAGSGRYGLQSSLTNLGLDTTAAGATIHGKVASPPVSGALVVAEPSGGGAGQTAIAATDGSYAIYNLAAGDWTVTAYAKGANYSPAAVATLGATEDRLENLSVKNTTTATVTGSFQPTGQNQPASLNTSAILVVRSTYSAAIDRGDAPPALRAGGLTSPSFSIDGVPDGQYVVLAAFENDGYVRDLSGIGGTAPVDVSVVNGVMTSAAQSFKITGAITLGTDASGTSPITPVSATAPQLGDVWNATGATPTFSWLSYSSAHAYQVSVVDDRGNEIWAPARVNDTPGTMSIVYAGPALVAGSTYQVRLFAFDNGGNQISRTEDLKGIFTYQP
jgi:hypothetical protein